MTVRHIKPDEPAARSDLKVGDRISQINGTYTLGLTKTQIYTMFGCDVVDVEYTSPLEPLPSSRVTKKKNRIDSSAPSATTTTGKAVGSRNANSPVVSTKQQPRKGQAIPRQEVSSTHIPSQGIQAQIPMHSSSSSVNNVEYVRSMSNGHLKNTITQPAQHEKPNDIPSREVIDLVSSDDEESEEDEEVVNEEGLFSLHDPIAPSTQTTSNSLSTISNTSINQYPFPPSHSLSSNGPSLSSSSHISSANNVIELLDDSDESDGGCLADDPFHDDLLLLFSNEVATSNFPSASVQGTTSIESTDEPSPKRRRVSSSQTDNFFCGVKVKLEPVDFGCANCDEVIEIQNPNILDKESQQVSCNDVGHTKLAGDDEDDDISFMGGNMTTMLDMPHARESCSKFPFAQPLTSFYMQPSRSNLKYCDYCYCYVCEIKAADCLYWESHAHATHKNSIWKAERTLLRSNLLKMLRPAKRRADFIQNTLKPKIMENVGDSNQRFKGILDDLKCKVAILYDAKSDIKLQNFTDADFLEIIILLTNILKKCQNEVRDSSSPGYRAMRYLSRALLSTKMFSVSFAHPDMSQAIREDMSSLSNTIAMEFAETLLHLTTPRAHSYLNWVYACRLQNRCDVPVAVGKLKSNVVAGIFFAALTDIGACPPSVLEFCYRQGDRLTAQCFYWLIASYNTDMAKIAMDRISKALLSRELRQQYPEDNTSARTQKQLCLRKICATLAVMAEKYGTFAGSEDLLCFYTSRFFRRGGVVDDMCVELFPASDVSVSDNELFFRESIQRMRKEVEFDKGGTVSIKSLPSCANVGHIYFFLMCFPFFARSYISLKNQQLKRIVTNVVLKDASPNCKLIFVHYLLAWGSLNVPDQTKSLLFLTDNITNLSCEIGRDLVAKDSSLLLKLPYPVILRWGELTNECDLSRIFYPSTFSRNKGGERVVSSVTLNNMLKVAPQSSYIPLYLYSNLAVLKQRDFSQLYILMPLMWKSFIVTIIDYIMNPNRFKMSTLMMFMQLLQGFDLDNQLTVMLQEVVLMHLFFDAVLASNSSSGMLDSDDYKLTKLLRRVVSGLKKCDDKDKGRWLFWQALISQILKNVVGENKYDLLNFIIIEDWATVGDNFVTDQAPSSPTTFHTKCKALLMSKPDDIDVKNKDACMYIWQRICALSPQLVNALASSDEPTLINTLLHHAIDDISTLSSHLISPSIYRLLNSILNKSPSEGESEQSMSLHSKWGEIKVCAVEYLRKFIEDNSKQPSRNDVLLSVVLNLKPQFSALFPRLASSQDIIELFHLCMSVAETTFLIENTLSVLRDLIFTNADFQNQLSQAIQYHDDLKRISSIPVIEVMAMLFPSLETITTLMAHKDEIGAVVVDNVFSHFKKLFSDGSRKLSVPLGDAFALFARCCDKNGIQDFFVNIYQRNINPLISADFLTSCFSYMKNTRLESGGILLSWLVVFCYRFYQEISRDLLFKLQECLLDFMQHMDCSEFKIEEFESNMNDLDGHNAFSDNKSLVIRRDTESLTYADVYCAQVEISGKDNLPLLHPKYAFNFLQLIIFPQTERYEVLPIHLLTQPEKRITLHFLFDIEHPVVFLTTALKTHDYESINEKFCKIPLDSVHWPNILAALRCAIEGHGGSINGCEFLSESMDLLMHLQVLSRVDTIDIHVKNLIGNFFNRLSVVLGDTFERKILNSIISFEHANISLLVSDIYSGDEDVRSVMCNLISKLCVSAASACWTDHGHRISNFVELAKIYFESQRKVRHDDSERSLWEIILQGKGFQNQWKFMLPGVFTQILQLLDSPSAQEEAEYISAMQTLISISQTEGNEVLSSLLPYVAETLSSTCLIKAITVYHVTSGYVTSTLWCQFINEILIHLTNPRLILYMNFLCQISAALNNLTSQNFFSAAASAADAGISQNWLSVLQEVIVVDDFQSAKIVAHFLFSIPKAGDHYTTEFWQYMFEKIRWYDLPTLAMVICTEACCGDPLFLSTLSSHEEILSALTVDLDSGRILDDPNYALYSLWGSLIATKDFLILTMLQGVVRYALSERLTPTKKGLLTNFLGRMCDLYKKANMAEAWTKFCRESAIAANKKKALVTILNNAV